MKLECLKKWTFSSKLRMTREWPMKDKIRNLSFSIFPIPRANFNCRWFWNICCRRSKLETPSMRCTAMKLLAKQIMSFYFAEIPVKGFSKIIAAKIQFNITYLMVICSIYTIYIMYDITFINFNFIIQNKSTSSTSVTSVSISSSRTTSCTFPTSSSQFFTSPRTPT